MNWVVRLLMRFATPSSWGHIYGQDGSLYMERFQLFAFEHFSARLHHIVREDRDRHLHDHPWDFVSIVLQGGYVEARPYEASDPLWIGEQEVVCEVSRVAPCIAHRRALDRHKITSVDPGTWTFFLTGPYKNKWGFFTPKGKVPYREYLGIAE